MKNRHTTFENIAKRYDILNNVISFGLHKFIKKRALTMLNFNKKKKVLDLCCGTGDIPLIIQKINPAIKITGVDFSSNMLNIAKNRCKNVEFIEADCSRLPLTDNTFDICTIFFGYRNIEDQKGSIKEIKRVLNNNGKFLHVDFNNKSYINCIFDVIINLAKYFAKNKEDYEYLIQSKNNFLSPKELIEEFEKNDFRFIKQKDYLFGIISAQYFELNN